MPTYVHFVPQPLQAFNFAATLDGQEITCQVPWSLFANRWYLSMIDTNGIVIAYRALIGSPNALVIKSMDWDQDDGVFVETLEPHMFEFMQTCNLTLTGVDPPVLNGIWSCFILSPTTFVFKNVGQNPVPIQSYGKVSCDVNLAAGYFIASTLVFRESTQYFEIVP